MATNIVTDRPSWAWTTGLVVLVLCGAGLAVITVRIDGQPPRDPATEAGSPLSQRVEVRGLGRSLQAGRDVNVGVTGWQALIAVVVVAVLAVAAVLVATRSVFPVDHQARPPASPSAAVQPPLLITMTEVGNDCSSVVFPLGDERGIPFIEANDWPADPQKFMTDELAAGAYAETNLTIRMNAQTDRSETVTVNDIGLVDVATARPVYGGSVDLETCQGEATDRLTLYVNRKNAGPFGWDEQAQEVSGERYFDRQVIKVAPGAKAGIIFTVAVDWRRPGGSYTFRVAVTYEVAGRLETVVVDNRGQPFRLTASVCPQATSTKAYDVFKPLAKVKDQQCGG